MRVEIDWNTDFDEVAMVAVDKGDTITAARKTISIQNPVMLLDYLSFEDEMKAGITEALTQGTLLPYAHTNISTKVIPANNTDTASTTDVQLALQGKLLMKMYVSHRLNNTTQAGVSTAAQIGCGRCRSQRNKGLEYNLYINDLAVHDLPVETNSEQYSFLELAHQTPVSVIPGGVKRNIDNAVAITALGTTQVNSGKLIQSGIDIVAAGGSSLSDTTVRDMVAGTQSYIGFDLAKYDHGSRVVPSNAGYRVGSAPVILRLTQQGSATADSQQARPKTVQVFTEEVRILQMRGKQVETFEA
jgi:hypothetical protein